MKTEYIKRCGRMLLVFVLYAVLITGAALAGEREGTIQVFLETDDGTPLENVEVEILRVADYSGRLTGDFTGTGLTAEQLKKDRYSRFSADLLLQHAAQNHLEGTSDESNSGGAAEFQNLEEGTYVIFCRNGQDNTFEPFLMTVPSSAGKWNLRAVPKTEEEPDSPDEPDKPDEPKQPDIPDKPEPTDKPDGPDDPDQMGEIGDQESGSGTIVDNPIVPGGEFSDGFPNDPSKIPQTGENYWTIWILIGCGILLTGSGLWCLRKGVVEEHE